MRPLGTRVDIAPVNVCIIGADFAGAKGANAPAVKILRGDAPAVTREVAPVNHGVIYGGYASDDEKCLSFIKRRMNINRQ